MKKMLLLSVLIISLIVVAIPVGFAVNPSPGEPPIQIAGPAIVGTITFQMDNGTLWATLEGKCKGQDFVLSTPMSFFGGCQVLNCITVEYFEGTETLPPKNRIDGLGGYLPAGCTSHLNTLDLMIFNVVKLTDYETYKIADVVIMFYSYK